MFPLTNWQAIFIVLHSILIVCSKFDLQTNDVKWISGLAFRIPYIQTLRWGQLDFMDYLKHINLFHI